MEPNWPFWFKQRQCKAESVGENMLRVTGPAVWDLQYIFAASCVMQMAGKPSCPMSNVMSV